MRTTAVAMQKHSQSVLFGSRHRLTGAADATYPRRMFCESMDRPLTADVMACCRLLPACG
jgi:hypothetical protein